MEIQQSHNTTNSGNNPKWLDIGEHYLNRYKLPIIPITGQKLPLIPWKLYQSQLPSIDEIKAWINLDDFVGLGTTTGSLSGILVLDIDHGADIDGLVFPKTPTVKTPHGGLHYYFKYPKDKTIKNFAGIRPNIDIRGEGGMVVMPPTKLSDGGTYEWINDLTTPLAEIPDWLLKDLTDKPTSTLLATDILNGVQESRRNTTAAQYAGQLLKDHGTDDWESVVWPKLCEWNLKNKPPLNERELRQVYESIANREISRRSKKQEILGFEIEVQNTDRLTLRKDGLKYAIFSAKGHRLDLGIYKDGQLLNRDNLLLTSAKNRVSFIKHCQFDDKSLEDKTKRQLIEIVQVLEEVNHQRSKQENEKEENLTEDEIKDAEDLLQSPTLFHEILGFIKKLGVIGEEKTALTHYIVFTSRITDEPISEIVKGESSAGKSYVVAKVMLMFPKNTYKDLTDATAQSFFYVQKNYFAHKIIIIFEKHGSEKTDYSIRSLQSEKKLKLQVTIKDPETGQFMATEKEVDGPVGFISTTTDARVHAENETRVLSVYPDDSKQQTERVLEISDFKYRGLSGPSDAEIKKWQNIQRVLKPYPIFIPFVEEIRKVFPKEPVRVRRDYSKFLSLLSVVTLLHQKQRTIKQIGEVEYLVASIADFYITKVLFEETLQKTIYELPPKSEFIIDEAKKLTSGALDNFSISELARAIGWEYDTTWKWFKPAYHKGFFLQTEEQKGPKAARYKLAGKEVSETKILPDAEELYEINPDWLGEAEIYNPLTGDALSFQGLESTDVLKASERT